MGAGGLQADAGSERVEAYLDYLIESGSNYRWGPGWRLDTARTDRIARERNLIAEMGFSAYFIILYDVMRQCRDMGVITGPGRGSVCSSLLCYVLRIHEIDSLERGLIFERFMTRDRVSYPDVDIDVSQATRDQVLEYVADAYSRDGNVVLAVGAFARNGARRVVDIMLNARSRDDEEAGRTATLLKQCLPEGNITGGAKVDRELSWWLEKGHGEREKFRDLATKAGWLDTMLKLDGTFSNLGRHAAGVMILSADDMRRLPTTSVDGKLEMTGFDMYALEKLGYPKYDFLGLRTLDVVSDARKLEGHSGSIDDLMTLWREHNHDPDPYRALHDGDTLGIFQMETPGYRRTVQEMKPDKFEHLVQLNALYRPGALDAKAEDGRTMVQVFLDRHRAKEKATYPVPEMKEVLAHTHGVLLFQEDTMRIARQLCGFDDATADMLRRAIGKKRHKEMMALEERFVEGWVQGGRSREMGQRLWENVVAASRYSWARAHAEPYSIITWLCMYLRYYTPAAFMSALINSYSKDKDRMVDAVSSARERVHLIPPDINQTQEGFGVEDGQMLFGLRGIKGMGASNRLEILRERDANGSFASFDDFCLRLPSVPVPMKLSLVRAGAFDNLVSRELLMATCPKKGKSDAQWTVAEHLNHNRSLKNPRPIPDIEELHFPTDEEMAEAERDTTGFYVSRSPLGEVEAVLRRCDTAKTIGGRIESIQRKKDRRGQEMAMIRLLTPDLKQRRVIIFASNWPALKPHMNKGEQWIMRGRHDGDSFLAEVAWPPYDMEHFRRAEVTHPDSSTESVRLNGGISDLVAAWEAQGCSVRLR